MKKITGADDILSHGGVSAAAEHGETDIAGEIMLYSAMVRRLARSRTRDVHTADDVFQEVFLRYIRHRDSLGGPEHRKAWLIRVTLNCAKSVLTSAARRNTQTLEEIADSMAFETPEESDVFLAVAELPEKYSSVVHLFYGEDMTVAEIAGALNTSEGTIKSRLYRAREILKKKLKGEYEYE